MFRPATFGKETLVLRKIKLCLPHTVRFQASRHVFHRNAWRIHENRLGSPNDMMVLYINASMSSAISSMLK